jgi:hypothetical protein
MNLCLCSVPPVWDETLSSAELNQSRAIHPKQGTLRKYGVAERHTGFQKTPGTGQFQSIFISAVA